MDILGSCCWFQFHSYYDSYDCSDQEFHHLLSRSHHLQVTSQKCSGCNNLSTQHSRVDNQKSQWMGCSCNFFWRDLLYNCCIICHMMSYVYMWMCMCILRCEMDVFLLLLDLMCFVPCFNPPWSHAKGFPLAFYWCCWSDHSFTHWSLFNSRMAHADRGSKTLHSLCSLGYTRALEQRDRPFPG